MQKKVISTAIDANIFASLRQLDPANVISVPVDYAALDFRLACEKMLSSETLHREMAENIQRQLQQIVEREKAYSSKIGIESRTRVPTNYESVSKECSNLLASRLSTDLQKKASVYVEFTSLCEEVDPNFKEGMDYYYHKVDYQVPPDGIECLEVVISEFEDETEFSLFADFSVLDDKGSPIECFVFPLEREEGRRGYRGLGIFFAHRVFESETQFVSLVQKEIIDKQFSRLVRDGWDYLEFGNARNGSYESISMVFGFPSNAADRFFVEVAKNPYDEDSKLANLVHGEAEVSFGILNEISSVGMVLKGIRAKTPVGKGELFTAIIRDRDFTRPS